MCQLVPATRLAAERNDDAATQPVLLSRFFKSERIEVSDDRLTAASTKGYRMVRATRGVAAGAWYFEVRVVHLGATGHTRLGWVTNRADLQTPVGYDAYGFGYRDIDGGMVPRCTRLGGTSMLMKDMGKEMSSGFTFLCLMGSSMSLSNLT